MSWIELSKSSQPKKNDAIGKQVFATRWMAEVGLTHFVMRLGSALLACHGSLVPGPHCRIQCNFLYLYVDVMCCGKILMKVT